LTEQDILYLFQILDHFEIDNLELLVHIPTVNLQKLQDLVETCQFYIDMHVLEANFEERFQNQKVTINPVHGTLDFLTSCGKINKDYFDSTSEGIRESKDHNSCLRGKISIDINGQIKNCPSMITSFGHFEETNFDEVISNPSFNKQWNINKDSISVCRDCEYRYVCTDCRAFTESGELFGKPLKCRYNPYKGVWEDD